MSSTSNRTLGGTLGHRTLEVVELVRRNHNLTGLAGWDSDRCPEPGIKSVAIPSATCAINTPLLMDTCHLNGELVVDTMSIERVSG